MCKKKSVIILMRKTLCIYTYFEKDQTYKKNCEYFLENGLNDSSDYLFVINGDSSIDFPKRTNIINIIHRKNTGYDFQAYTEALRTINISNYNYFIFMNTSVRGPYIDNKSNWQSKFTNLIKGDTKLVGTTINIHCTRASCNFDEEKHLKSIGLSRPYTHVQSQVFAMDRECLLFIKDRIFIDYNPNHSFIDTIINKEILMSQYVLKNNWNIDCVIPEYQGLDYRILKEDINPTSDEGDANYAGAYFGRTLEAEEVIFIKTNRDLLEKEFIENFINKNDITVQNNSFKYKVRDYIWIISVVIILISIYYVLYRFKRR
jgi:hypothetical protein